MVPERAVAVVQLLRFENVLFVVLLAWIGLGVGDAPPDARTAIAVIATVVGTLAAGNVVNDLVDEELDRVGKPGRPLPSGRVSRRFAGQLLAMSVAVALAGIVILPNMLVRTVAVGMLALAFLYSVVLKSVPLVGNLGVALEVALVLGLAALATGGVTPEVGALALVIFVSYLVYEYAKTARDRWHDVLFVKTAATAWRGSLVWRFFVGLLVLDAVVLSAAAVSGSVEGRVLVALALPVLPFVWFAMASRHEKNLDGIGPTAQAAKLLFVPALGAMALWL